MPKDEPVPKSESVWNHLKPGSGWGFALVGLAGGRLLDRYQSPEWLEWLTVFYGLVLALVWNVLIRTNTRKLLTGLSGIAWVSAVVVFVVLLDPLEGNVTTWSGRYGAGARTLEPRADQFFNIEARTHSNLVVNVAHLRTQPDQLVFQSLVALSPTQIAIATRFTREQAEALLSELRLQLDGGGFESSRRFLPKFILVGYSLPIGEPPTEKEFYAAMRSTELASSVARTVIDEHFKKHSAALPQPRPQEGFRGPTK